MKRYHAFSVACNIEYYNDLAPMDLHDGAHETIDAARGAVTEAWTGNGYIVQASIAYLEDSGDFSTIQQGRREKDGAWIWVDAETLK